MPLEGPSNDVEMFCRGSRVAWELGAAGLVSLPTAPLSVVNNDLGIGGEGGSRVF